VLLNRLFVPLPAGKDRQNPGKEKRQVLLLLSIQGDRIIVF